MEENDLRLLKNSTDSVVRIRCYDGEVIVAKIRHVSEEDEDVVYDLISSDKQSHYEKFDEQPAYLVRFQDIESVETIVA